MALVMVVIGFSQAFLDMGISNAIIHKQVITHRQLSTLYWVNVLAGFVLFAIICAVAPLVASFYHEPELTLLTILVGVTFLIQPFGQQFMVLWQKEMRFAEMAKIDIINKLVSLAVSVWFAYDGHGVYALVYGTIAGTVIQTLQFMILGLREHKPSFIFRVAEIKEFMSFGAYQMGERTINYFNSQIDTILIGKLLGAEALGIYSIAKQLIMRPAQIFNPIITKVTFPMMAKIQDDTERLKNIYLKTIHYLSSVNFPIYALMIVLAPELVMVLFGDRWMDAVPIVQILSIYGALRSTGNPIGSLLLAKGRAKLGFYWNLGLFFYVPLGVYVSSQWGLIGVSWGLVFIMASLIIPNWYFQVRPLCWAEFFEYHWQIIQPMVISVILVIAGYFLSGYIENVFLKMGLISLAGAAIVIGVNMIFNRKMINELKGMVRK
jgi:O-antigen/teichoic acid export membrane protein